MSVRQYDEQPFLHQIEAYHELERGQWIEVRRNDVDVAVGSKGVVLKQIAETGNYQVAVEVEGKAQKRIVALCPDQVRPVDPPLPGERTADADPERPATGNRMSAEGRERQRQATKAYWERKKAERQAAAPAEPQPKAKPKRRLAPTDIDAQLASTSAKLAEQAAGILNMPAEQVEKVAPALMTRHRPDGMDERIAAAVVGVPEVEPEAKPFDPVVGAGDLMLGAIRQLQAYREPEPPTLVAVTWTKRAADAIRPVLAEAAAAGGEVTQLALLVETISYLEDGGRP